MMFTFLSLAVAGYCANGQAGSEVNADAQQQTVYICVVTSSSGTEVIATRVNGDCPSPAGRRSFPGSDKKSGCKTAVSLL